ncbi:MAG: hypothetical protein ABSC48_04530 [Terracidiphilus sp.]|jgi:hypothetical protein
MSILNKSGEVGDLTEEPEMLDEALQDFRLSLHAWSESAYSWPRRAVEPGQRRVWRLATAWALVCVLAAGGASAGLWEHHRQEMKIAAARLVEQQRRLAAQQRARQEEEDLLAKVDLAGVDSDVSREVPSAMEPLAQLMAEDETR